MSDMNKKFVEGTTFNGWTVTKVNDESVWLSYGGCSRKFKVLHYMTGDAAMRNGLKLWSYNFN